jgi:hypothetical protein
MSAKSTQQQRFTSAHCVGVGNAQRTDRTRTASALLCKAERSTPSAGTPIATRTFMGDWKQAVQGFFLTCPLFRHR